MVAVGATVTFDCLPQAWPEPRIQWRHNGRLIEPDQFRLADGGAKYTIGRIARTDLNIARGGGGGDPTNEAETLVTNGRSQPTLPYASNGGQPTASATNQPGLSDSDGRLVDVFGSRLTIRQADKGDEGRYSCLVETKGSHRLIERESPIAHLTAYGKLTTTSALGRTTSVARGSARLTQPIRRTQPLEHHSVKPYFTEAPEHKSAQVGDQVRIRCRMSGEPEPVISWRRQSGQPLSEK